VSDADVRSRFTDDEWLALVEAPSMAAMAVYAVGRPSLPGKLLELLVGGAAAHHRGDHGAADDLVRAVDRDEESFHVQRDLSTKVSSFDHETMTVVAIDGLRRAGAVLAGPGAPEAAGFTSWVLDVARAVAEAASDRHDTAKVSEAEKDVLERIGRVLRGEEAA